MATIADKSRAKEIIEHLQGMINNASPVPLASGKVMVYKDEMQTLLKELESNLMMEIRTYHEVNDRKGKIINEAKKEAEQIIYQAEHTASRMRVQKRSTRVSPLDYTTLNEEERGALGNANEIYGASLIYTDEMLTEVTNLIADAYRNIQSDYEIIIQALNDKLNTIMSNREELMAGLQEMDIEDRSQQILEIGQLLSTELYNSRMKAKIDSDEYEDGSVQLTLDLQEEQEEKTRLAEEEAKRATQALAEMTAQRDALMETVEQMKNQGMGNTVRSIRENEVAAKEDDYEFVYVTEDELEEGEEYEIEYVDEDEYEQYVKNSSSSEEQESPTFVEQEVIHFEKEEKDSVNKKGKESNIPLIPHFKKSEKIASIDADQVAKIADTSIEEETILSESRKLDEEKNPQEIEKDEDIRTDENGNEYVQATMKFDSNFEITEF